MEISTIPLYYPLFHEKLCLIIAQFSIVEVYHSVEDSSHTFPIYQMLSPIQATSVLHPKLTNNFINYRMFVNTYKYRTQCPSLQINSNKKNIFQTIFFLLYAI